MISRFFINRPIFASVISIVIMIAGAVAQLGLPVAKFPEIAPPTVQVTCFYPGANAQVLAETVAAPIEQEVNGVEGMIYMSSTSADDGSYALNVTFNIGTDIDMATVLVQNRVAIATPKLPEEVRRQGVTTKKQSTSILQFIAFSSTDPRIDALYLSNYVKININDELSRIPGVGSIKVFGAEEYSMRVWLDPERLKARQLTTEDVVKAIQEQNVQVAAGRIGEPPTPDDIAFQLVVNTKGRLSEVSEFEDLIVKASPGGRIIRVRDVARVERGAKSYNWQSSFNGDPCATIAVYQLPGANGLEVAAKIEATLDRLSKSFPAGMKYAVPFDTTRFVHASIAEVYETLFIAVVLVVLVIYIFLQDWRATLIPCAAIPVSLIGAFAFMAAMGFSINMLTLFGIVLAIGIVVDDAIVVVESTAANIDKGMTSKEAALAAMEEITGPVIATTLVLLAVFVPTAFMGGITGQLYRQFSLTISAAVVISSINALTMSPALCAILMRPAPEKRNFLFRAFNNVFERIASVYGAVGVSIVRRLAVSLMVFGGLVALTGWGFSRLPTGFLPTEDQGYAFVNVQLPDAAAIGRTQEVMDHINTILKETPGVADWVMITGFSILSNTNGSNNGMVAVVYEPWDERTTPELSQDAIVNRLRGEFRRIRDAFVIAFVPPAIDGLGNAGGFQLQLQDRGNAGLEQLQTVARELVEAGNGQTGLQAVNTTFRASVPQLFVDIDRTKVKTLGVPLTSVFNTLQAYLGSTYVNDFNQFGRTYQVRLQADHQFRLDANAIKKLDVRNQNGDMLPLGTFVKVEDTLGPQVIQRYNLYPSAQINGEAAPGFSSGQALQLVEQMADKTLPPSMGYEWTGMSYQEKQVGNEQYFIFALAVVFVFLVLAAQYESWTSPAAVISVVPLAALGVVIVLFMRHADNNVYTQIGVVLLVALASKNAILIVEFASELRKKGQDISEAATQAARLRFRAILMTAFSSILGFLPLLVSSGAGAASRQAVGNAVVGGMIAATFFSLLFVPTFFVVFRSLSEWSARKPKASRVA
ncbi:efflux RND transporter permease subunit [Bythopirellula polymerisocia]|uniref:Efflux pump membrane transporter BepE n=1 Tax=Bythopirellula polymerisocia TaxID=2528003 RepID=A0A5C6D3G0_9BACT|nr:multidrug efflux RND transporter permease subunit [Bythopirellula polymerisocia]TWU30197.1 Efflux pump membrane transporter BepE [Bythopirellula polymerisocia]